MNQAKILLIEPDRVLARSYIKFLSSFGFSITHVSTAQDALIAADKTCPDLVICELLLVSHSGIEFLYEFRSYHDWQGIPIIILSNVSLGEFFGSQKGLYSTLGVGKYLYKPSTSLKALLKEINELIGEGRAYESTKDQSHSTISD